MNVSRLMRRITRRTDASGAMAPEYVVIIIIPAFFLGMVVYNSGRTIGSTFDILSGETPVPTYPMSYGGGNGSAGNATTSGGGGTTAPTYSPLGPLFVNEANGTAGGTTGGTAGGTTGGTGGTAGGTTSTTTTSGTTAAVVPPAALLTPYVDNRATLNGVAMSYASPSRYGDQVVSYRQFDEPAGMLFSSVYGMAGTALTMTAMHIPYMPVSYDRVFEITSTIFNLRMPSMGAITNLDYGGQTSQIGLSSYVPVTTDYFLDLNNTPFGTGVSIGTTTDIFNPSGSTSSPNTSSGAYNYSSYFSLTTKVTYTIPAWVSGNMSYNHQYQAR